PEPAPVPAPEPAPVPAPEPVPAPDPAPAAANAAEQTGQVSFVSEPAGATILVDGINLGTTPVTVTLGYGSHTVQYSKTNHTALEQAITVSAPDTLLPTVRLQEIALFTREGEFMVFFPGRDGDTLKVDGATIGALPTTVRLTEGQHRFSVSGSGGDPVEVVQQVVVTNGQGRILLTAD
ncbi:MAG: hypothetical protein ACI9K2_003137, partial [Myxococcota bacterium]